MEKMIKRTMILGISLVIMVTMFLALASSAQLLCLSKGQKVLYSQCNPQIHDFTCTSTTCQQCATEPSPGVFCPASLNSCNNQGAVCDSTTQNNSIDTEPPQISILSPEANHIYNSKSISLNVNLDEAASISYWNAQNPKSSWTNVCRSCSSYNNKKTFLEGLNEVVIRAVDFNGNTAYSNVTFLVDSQKPQLIKTTPRSGFTNGVFNVTFKESAPTSLKLYYGPNATKVMDHTQNLNIGNDCVLSKGLYFCTTTIDLSSFNGQDIFYSFNLTDVSGNNVGNKPLKLKVDSQIPIVNFLDINQSGTMVNIYLNVTEANLDKVQYIDLSSPLPHWSTLCTSLKNGICQRKITLKPGQHQIIGSIRDKAGNHIEAPFNINI